MSEAPPDTPLDRARALKARADDDDTPSRRHVRAWNGFSDRLARSALSEEAVEKLARELAWQLGDTMGDARGVFLSSAMHTDGERWRKAARAVLAALVEMGGEG